MTTETQCPVCDGIYETKRDYNREIARCPDCEEIFIVAPVGEPFAEDLLSTAEALGYEGTSPPSSATGVPVQATPISLKFRLRAVILPVSAVALLAILALLMVSRAKSNAYKRAAISQFESAERLLQREDFVRAIRGFTQFINDYPGSERTEHAGRLIREAEEGEKAQKMLSKAQRLQEDGKHDEAIKQLDDFLKAAAEDSKFVVRIEEAMQSTLYAAGETGFESGNYDSAVRSLNELVKKYPKAKNANQARELLKKAERQAAQATKAAELALAEQLLKEEDYDAAIKRFGELAEKYPEIAGRAEKLKKRAIQKKEAIESAFKKVDDLIRATEYDNAKTAVDQLLKDFPKSKFISKSKAERATSSRNDGRTALKEKKYAAAVQHFEEALAYCHPDSESEFAQNVKTALEGAKYESSASRLYEQGKGAEREKLHYLAWQKYQELIEEHPKSVFAEDARQAIKRLAGEITRIARDAWATVKEYDELLAEGWPADTNRNFNTEGWGYDVNNSTYSTLSKGKSSWKFKSYRNQIVSLKAMEAKKIGEELWLSKDKTEWLTSEEMENQGLIRLENRWTNPEKWLESLVNKYQRKIFSLDGIWKGWKFFDGPSAKYKKAKRAGDYPARRGFITAAEYTAEYEFHPWWKDDHGKYRTNRDGKIANLQVKKTARATFICLLANSSEPIVKFLKKDPGRFSQKDNLYSHRRRRCRIIVLNTGFLLIAVYKRDIGKLPQELEQLLQQGLRNTRK